MPRGRSPLWIACRGARLAGVACNDDRLGHAEEFHHLNRQAARIHGDDEVNPLAARADGDRVGRRAGGGARPGLQHGGITANAPPCGAMAERARARWRAVHRPQRNGSRPELRCRHFPPVTSLCPRSYHGSPNRQWSERLPHHPQEEAAKQRAGQQVCRDPVRRRCACGRRAANAIVAAVGYEETLARRSRTHVHRQAPLSHAGRRARCGVARRRRAAAHRVSVPVVWPLAFDVVLTRPLNPRCGQAAGRFSPVP